MTDQHTDPQPAPTSPTGPTGPAVTSPTATAPPATVRVRLFAGARAAAGVPHADVPLAPSDSVADVLQRLCDEHPALARVVPACSFLLDGVSARAHDEVSPATELDVLPPFSGG